MSTVWSTLAVHGLPRKATGPTGSCQLFGNASAKRGTAVIINGVIADSQHAWLHVVVSIDNTLESECERAPAASAVLKRVQCSHELIQWSTGQFRAHHSAAEPPCFSIPF
jgi:hypothetical protein